MPFFPSNFPTGQSSADNIQLRSQLENSNPNLMLSNFSTQQEQPFGGLTGAFPNANLQADALQQAILRMQGAPPPQQRQPNLLELLQRAALGGFY